MIDSSKNLKFSTFLNEESWLLFSFFESSCSSWLATSADLWPGDDGCNIMLGVVHSLDVVNDTAERSSKLAQDYSTKLTKDDNELQQVL